MKKIFLFAAAAMFIGTAANAQDVYKQTGGEQNIEVLFAPLGGSPIGINGIKYRKFTSATTAWRAEVFLGFSSSTDIRTELNSNFEPVELDDKANSFDLVLSPGLEWHLPGTDRLSPYYGAVLNIGFSRTNDKSEFLGASDAIEEMDTKNGSLNLGLAGVGGFDFYFADNIYMGAEIGVGFGFTNEFDTVMESTVSGSETVETPNGSSLNFGPIVQGSIRLGILF
jgi:opacity protein-like surface antigen